VIIPCIKHSTNNEVPFVFRLAFAFLLGKSGAGAQRTRSRKSGSFEL
jgi:hypothetical protein